jgi:hypothetical protein
VTSAVFGAAGSSWSVDVWRERDGGATGYAECLRRSYGEVAGARLSADEMRAFAAALLEAAEVLDR